MASGTFQELQHKIRADALEQQSALSSLQSWQVEIKAKDASLKTGAGKPSVPAPRNARPSTDPASREGGHTNQQPPSGINGAGGSAASHTYDQGYEKWEQFAAKVDENDKQATDHESVPIQVNHVQPVASPADIFGLAETSTKSVASAKARTVLRAGNANDKLDPAALEKERGNEAFREGKFQRAVEAYSRSLGYEPQAPLVLSNRAESHLRLKDYRRAMEDATAALKLLPGHVKTLLRRGRAAAASGRLRDALCDLTAALRIEPDNKRVQAELRKAREQRRAAMQRAPKAPLQALANASAARLQQEPPGSSTGDDECAVHIPLELVYDL